MSDTDFGAAPEPWPGMSEAFNAYMGAPCWTDPAYQPDAATWAAAWEAAQRAQDKCISANDSTGEILR